MPSTVFIPKTYYSDSEATVNNFKKKYSLNNTGSSCCIKVNKKIINLELYELFKWLRKIRYFNKDTENKILTAIINPSYDPIKNIFNNLCDLKTGPEFTEQEKLSLLETFTKKIGTLQKSKSSKNTNLNKYQVKKTPPVILTQDKVLRYSIKDILKKNHTKYVENQHGANNELALSILTGRYTETTKKQQVIQNEHTHTNQYKYVLEEYNKPSYIWLDNIAFDKALYSIEVFFAIVAEHIKNQTPTTLEKWLRKINCISPDKLAAKKKRAEKQLLNILQAIYYNLSDSAKTKLLAKLVKDKINPLFQDEIESKDDEINEEIYKTHKLTKEHVKFLLEQDANERLEIKKLILQAILFEIKSNQSQSDATTLCELSMQGAARAWKIKAIARFGIAAVTVSEGLAAFFLTYTNDHENALGGNILSNPIISGIAGAIVNCVLVWNAAFTLVGDILNGRVTKDSIGNDLSTTKAWSMRFWLGFSCISGVGFSLLTMLAFDNVLIKIANFTRSIPGFIPPCVFVGVAASIALTALFYCFGAAMIKSDLSKKFHGFIDYYFAENIFKITFTEIFRHDWINADIFSSGPQKDALDINIKQKAKLNVYLAHFNTSMAAAYASPDKFNACAFLTCQSITSSFNIVFFMALAFIAVGAIFFSTGFFHVMAVIALCKVFYIQYIIAKVFSFIAIKSLATIANGWFYISGIIPGGMKFLANAMNLIVQCIYCFCIWDSSNLDLLYMRRIRERYLVNPDEGWKKGNYKSDIIGWDILKLVCWVALLAVLLPNVIAQSKGPVDSKPGMFKTEGVPGHGYKHKYAGSSWEDATAVLGGLGASSSFITTSMQFCNGGASLANNGNAINDLTAFHTTLTQKQRDNFSWFKESTEQQQNQEENDTISLSESNNDDYIEIQQGYQTESNEAVII